MLVLLAALAAPGATVQAKSKPLAPTQRETLEEYAAATWHSFVMMTNPTTGLPSDNVSAEGVRARYTSPTNIAAYIWAALAARDLQIIKPSEARERIAVTLRTL